METNRTEANMIALDTTRRAARMLEAGRVTVTFRSPSGSHITLLAKCRGRVNGKWQSTPLRDAQVIFIEVPGQGGWNDKVGKVNARGFHPDATADTARTFCAKQLLAFLAGQQTAAALEIFEEDRCGRCGRQLTDPVSIERGIGPECYGRETGSQHETKTKRQAAPVETLSEITGDMHGAFDPAPRTADEQADHDGTTEYAQREIARDQHSPCNGVDAQGVAYGYGDWKNRKKVAKAGVRNSHGSDKLDTLLAGKTPGDSQMQTLPGDSFEAIFA